MSRCRLALIGAGALLLGAHAAQAETIRCESRDNRFVYCNLPVRGHVEVYKQNSSNPCTYGRSWGSERNRVWVSNGCRAEFAIY